MILSLSFSCFYLIRKLPTFSRRMLFISSIEIKDTYGIVMIPDYVGWWFWTDENTRQVDRATSINIYVWLTQDFGFWFWKTQRRIPVWLNNFSHMSSNLFFVELCGERFWCSENRLTILRNVANYSEHFCFSEIHLTILWNVANYSERFWFSENCLTIFRNIVNYSECFCFFCKIASQSFETSRTVTNVSDFRKIV